MVEPNRNYNEALGRANPNRIIVHVQFDVVTLIEVVEALEVSVSCFAIEVYILNSYILFV